MEWEGWNTCEVGNCSGKKRRGTENDWVDLVLGSHLFLYNSRKPEYFTTVKGRGPLYRIEVARENMVG